MKLIVEIFCLTLSVCCCMTVPVGSSGLYYDGAKMYRYSYEAEVTLNEADLMTEDKVHRMHADVGLKVGAVFQLSSRWTNPNNNLDQIIEMQFEEAEIFNVSDRRKKDNSFYSTRRSKALRSISKPLIFRWTNGQISELYVNSAETVTSLNVKRGMLGLLQLQTHTGQRKEDDPSGSCLVSYVTDGTEVQKIKDVSSCVNKEERYTSMNKALGVTSAATSRAIYTLSGDLSHILFAVAMESHSVRVNVKQDISLYIVGRQKLGLLDYSQQTAKVSKTKEEALKKFATEQKKDGAKYVKHSIVSERDVRDCAEGCLNIIEVVDQFHDDLTKENMANTSSVQAYITAVRAARQADQKTLSKLMKLKTNEDIKFTLIDVLAAAQTRAALSVLMKELDFASTENTGYIERALTGIAFSSHPSEAALIELTAVFKQKIGSDKVRETVGLTLGAVLNKFCNTKAENCESKVAQEIRNLIKRGLKEAKTEDEETMYIQFVRNSGQPEFIEHLLKFAEFSEFPLVHHLAISTLNIYDVQHLDNKVKKAMGRIFHQNNLKYESTVRSAAANLLLVANPSEREVQNIIMSLSYLKSRELANFILARINDLIKTGHPSRDVLVKVMTNSKYSNYWTLAQSGMASAFTGYLHRFSDSSGTYALFMEYSNAGMMRRTAVDFSLHSQNSSISLTQLGIVAQGLEGLTGSTPDEGEEELDSMVGMASSMMGVKLRPLTFFRGYSNMMSLIWSGSSGDPTGVEAMLMLTDYLQHVLLSSGLRVKAEVMGAISTKITAEITFSLWNRNVEIVTTNGGALSVQCRLTLESPMIRASVRNALDTQSALEFSVFTDFSSLPPKSCMRLSYPSLTFVETLRKFEKVRGSEKKLLAMRRQQTNVQGITLPLHQGNSEMCGKILTT